MSRCIVCQHEFTPDEMAQMDTRDGPHSQHDEDCMALAQHDLALCDCENVLFACSDCCPSCNPHNPALLVLNFNYLLEGDPNRNPREDVTPFSLS